MRYILYRIKMEDFENLDETDKLKIDFSPVELKEDNNILVFISGTMDIIGKYNYVKGYLLLDKVLDNNLKDFYGKLSFAKEVGPRTYKVFAKKIRELTKEDYDLIITD